MGWIIKIGPPNFAMSLYCLAACRRIERNWRNSSYFLPENAKASRLSTWPSLAARQKMTLTKRSRAGCWLLALPVLFFAAAAALQPAFGQIPPGWTDEDIGAPSFAGSASYSAGNWTVAGGGSDIWNAAD